MEGLNVLASEGLGSLGPVAVATAAAIILGLFLRGSAKGIDADRLWQENRRTIERQAKEISEGRVRDAEKDARIDELERDNLDLKMENFVLKMNQRKPEDKS